MVDNHGDIHDLTDRQEITQDLVDQQVLDPSSDEMPQDKNFLRCGDPLRGSHDTVVSAMVHMAHIVSPFPPFVVTGYPGCFTGATPFFVFRASPKHPKRRSFFLSCRVVVNGFDRRNRKRNGGQQGLVGFVGCKRKRDFLGPRTYQGRVKIRVVVVHGDRECSLLDTSYITS